MAHVTKMEDQERSSTDKVGGDTTPVTGGSVDERQLVRRAQKGDKVAFETLAPVTRIKDGPMRLLVAAKLGKTRLIDNVGV